MWDATNDTTLQQTVYYASGLPLSVSSGQSTQPYKYNGKEFIEMHGLDVTDLGFRSVHNARGRFDNMDPLCEQAYHSSPYAISANNPIINVDVLGLESMNFNATNFKMPGGSLNWTVVDNNGNVVGHEDDPSDNHIYLDDCGGWDGTKAGLSSLTQIGWEIPGYTGYTLRQPCYYIGQPVSGSVVNGEFTRTAGKALMYGNKQVQAQKFNGGIFFQNYEQIMLSILSMAFDVIDLYDIKGVPPLSLLMGSGQTIYTISNKKSTPADIMSIPFNFMPFGSLYALYAKYMTQGVMYLEQEFQNMVNQTYINTYGGTPYEW